MGLELGLEGRDGVMRGLLRGEVRVGGPVVGVQWIEGLGPGPSPGLGTMPAPSPAAEGRDEAGEEGGNKADGEERVEGDEGTVKCVEISKPAVLPVVLDVDLFSPARAYTPPKPRRRRTRPRIGSETFRTPLMFPAIGLNSSRGKEKAGVVTFRTPLSPPLGPRTNTPVGRDDVMMSGVIQGGVLHGRLHERLHEDNKRLRGAEGPD